MGAAPVVKITVVGIGAVRLRRGVFVASRLTRLTSGRGSGCWLDVFPRRALHFLGGFARLGLHAADRHGVFEESAPQVTVLALGVCVDRADFMGGLAGRALFVVGTRAIRTTC